MLRHITSFPLGYSGICRAVLTSSMEVPGLVSFLISLDYQHSCQYSESRSATPDFFRFLYFPIQVGSPAFWTWQKLRLEFCMPLVCCRVPQISTESAKTTLGVCCPCRANAGHCAHTFLTETLMKPLQPRTCFK